MRLVALSLAILSMAFAQLTGAPATKPALSGHWLLDLQRTKLQMKAPDSGTFDIRIDGNRFRLHRVFTLAGKAASADVESEIGGPATTAVVDDFVVHNRTYWKGDVLVLDGVWLRGDEQATNVVEYRLEDGGQTLVAHEVFTAPRSKHDNFWVFTRN